MSIDELIEDLTDRLNLEEAYHDAVKEQTTHTGHIHNSEGRIHVYKQILQLIDPDKKGALLC